LCIKKSKQYFIRVASLHLIVVILDWLIVFPYTCIFTDKGSSEHSMKRALAEIAEH